MKIVLSGLVVAGFFASAVAEAADWEKPALLPLTKICGKVVREKTPFDGVQTVFTELDRRGTALDTLFLSPVGGDAEGALSALKQDEKVSACIVGVPRTLAKGTAIADSPNTFLTIQLIR